NVLTGPNPPEPLQRAGAIRLQRQLVGEGMADIADWNALLFVDLRLEGKQRQHVRHRLLYPVDAFAAPGPDRRADEMDAGNAGVLDALFQPQIEVGSVHADEHVRLVLEHVSEQLLADAG